MIVFQFGLDYHWLGLDALLAWLSTGSSGARWWLPTYVSAFICV
jgi:hypothetical protein